MRRTLFMALIMIRIAGIFQMARNPWVSGSNFHLRIQLDRRFIITIKSVNWSALIKDNRIIVSFSTVGEIAFFEMLLGKSIHSRLDVLEIVFNLVWVPTTQ